MYVPSKRTQRRLLRAQASVRDWNDNAASIGNQPSTTRQDLSEMLTAKELEALLKIDVKTIYSYVSRGRVPYVKIESNVRFIRQQILDWIEEHNFRPVPIKNNRVAKRSTQK